MASAQKKTTLCCRPSSPSPDLADKASSASLRREAVSAVVPMAEDWSIKEELGNEKRDKTSGTRIPRADFDSVDVIAEAAKPAPAPKGTSVWMMRAETRHPLDPLSPAEIAVTIATVRAAGATPEVRDGMRFIEIVLKEPEKHVVALADAYFFPPFQPSLLPKTKGGPVIPRQLPPRQARLVVYNKRSNETSVWIVELSEVHAAARGGHHRGKVIASNVIPNVQPPMEFRSTLK